MKSSDISWILPHFPFPSSSCKRSPSRFCSHYLSCSVATFDRSLLSPLNCLYRQPLAVSTLNYRPHLAAPRRAPGHIQRMPFLHSQESLSNTSLPAPSRSLSIRTQNIRTQNPEGGSIRLRRAQDTGARHGLDFSLIFPRLWYTLHGSGKRFIRTRV